MRIVGPRRRRGRHGGRLLPGAGRPRGDADRPQRHAGERGPATAMPAWSRPATPTAWASPAALKMFLQVALPRDLGIKVRLQPRSLFPAVDACDSCCQCTTARAHANTTVQAAARALFHATASMRLAQQPASQYDSGASRHPLFLPLAGEPRCRRRHMRYPRRARPEDRDGRPRPAGRDRAGPRPAPRTRSPAAIYSPMDQTGDSCMFARKLAAWCERAAGRAVSATARRSRGSRSRATASAPVKPIDGPIAADAFVLAMGAESGAAGPQDRHRSAGLSGQGLFRDRADRRRGRAPTMGGVDEDKLIAYSRLGDRLRLACHRRIRRLSTAATSPRISRRCSRTAQRAVPRRVRRRPRRRCWAGLRPMTPNSVPILGPRALREPLSRYRPRPCRLDHGCGSGRNSWPTWSPAASPRSIPTACSTA